MEIPLLPHVHSKEAKYEEHETTAAVLACFALFLLPPFPRTRVPR